MPFREWNFVFREWNFQFRELLREYPGTLRELREEPLHSENVFPEIGVVPRLLSISLLGSPALLTGEVHPEDNHHDDGAHSPGVSFAPEVDQFD